MTILLVDDSRATRRLHKNLLEAEGHADVLTAGSAHEAFKCLGMDDPESPAPDVDLILMDISMPDMDGVEACFWIKATPHLADIPIVMVTSHREIHYLDEAFGVGAMDYITKPVNKVELRARVCSALALKYEMDGRKLALLELEAKNKELELHTKTRTEVLAQVTHDLHQPLTSLKGHIELMLENRHQVGPLNERQQKYLETVMKSSHRMKAMVDNLSDISMIENGNMSLAISDVNVGQVISDIAESMEIQTREKGIQVSIDIPANVGPVQADELRLSQIVSNLLSNACKYSPPGSTVTVSAKENPGLMQIHVSDNGRGISKDDQSQVFAKFFRSNDPETLKEHGVGLGLFITQHLVKAHGGKIWVQSDEAGGSTFSFSLPLKNAHDKELAKYKILVVDDHTPTRMICSRILEDQGYQIIQADNGLEGCEKAISECPSLILLDVMMPSMGGFEALEKLKADAATKSIPVVMLTYKDLPYDLTSAFEKGASGYIIKPVAADDLSDCISRVLGAVKKTK